MRNIIPSRICTNRIENNLPKPVSLISKRLLTSPCQEVVHNLVEINWPGSSNRTFLTKMSVESYLTTVPAVAVILVGGWQCRNNFVEDNLRTIPPQLGCNRPSSFRQEDLLFNLPLRPLINKLGCSGHLGWWAGIWDIRLVGEHAMKTPPKLVCN